MQQESTRQYMREYMKKKHKEDPQKANAYRNSLRYKKRYNLPSSDLKKYKHHLADIMILRQLQARIPREYLAEELKTVRSELEPPPSEPETVVKNEFCDDIF